MSVFSVFFLSYERHVYVRVYRFGSSLLCLSVLAKWSIRRSRWNLAPKLDTLGEIHGRDAGRRGGKTKGDERRHRETHKIHSAHLIILCFWSIPRRVPLSQSPSAGIVPFAHTPLRRVTRIRTVYGFSKPDRLSTIHTCTPASGTRARSRRPRL